MPQAQSVSCFVMLAAGSRYETPETNGIAHFAEHMFFKGTERRPTARDIAGEIDAIGGEFNAFTGKEYTGYYVKCAAEHRDIALDVLVDMLRHSKFDAEEIEREKGVIVEEMNMYFDTPRDFVDGVYDELLYGDQPLGWDIIGRKETVRGATRETFLDYLDRWYRPARMVVGVGGAVGDDARRAARGAARRPRADGATGAPAAVDARRERRAAREGAHEGSPTRRTSASASAATRSTTPTATSLQLLATVLGGGMSSRLFTEVRERRGLAYYVFGDNHGYTDAGLALLAGGRRHRRGSTRPSRRSSREFAPHRRRAGAGGRAREGAELRQGPVRAPAREPAGHDHRSACAARCSRARRASRTRCSPALDAVTAEDVQRVAQDVIGANGLNLALIGPFDDAARFEALLASG